MVLYIFLYWPILAVTHLKHALHACVLKMNVINHNTSSVSFPHLQQFVIYNVAIYIYL